MWFGYNPQIIFCHFFCKLNLAIFQALYNNVNGQGIPCGGNFFYSFILILLKLQWCIGHDLMICMWFGYNPKIIFCHFNFIGVLVMVLRYACGLDIILRLFFVTFFAS